MAAGLRATVFFAGVAFLAAGFFATAFLAAGLRATVFFAGAAFFAAGFLAAGFFATVAFLTTFLVAVFTAMFVLFSRAIAVSATFLPVS